MAKKEFTHNEAVALMDRNAANCLRIVANFIEQRELSKQEIIATIRMQADGLDEAAIDVDMRDSKGLVVTG